MYASDLSHKLNCTEKQVIDIKHEFHIKTKEIIVGNIVETNITDEDALFIEKTILKRREEKAEAERLANEEREKKFLSNLDALKAEHPLVTDIRCLKPSYWPDVVPNCFKELGDD